MLHKCDAYEYPNRVHSDVNAFSRGCSSLIAVGGDDECVDGCANFIGDDVHEAGQHGYYHNCFNDPRLCPPDVTTRLHLHHH